MNNQPLYFFDVNDRIVNNNNFETPLLKATRLEDAEQVKLLLAQKASLEQRNEDGETPIHVAVNQGNIDVLNLLLQSKSKTEIQTCINQGTFPMNRSPLHLAALNGGQSMIRHLLDLGADKQARDFQGCTPFFYAITSRHFIASSILLKGLNSREKADFLEARNSQGDTALHVVVNAGHVTAVAHALTLGADRMAKNHDGFTALELAMNQNNPAVIDALFKGLKRSTVNALLKGKDKNGDTLLQRAIKNRNQAVCDYFLRNFDALFLETKRTIDLLRVQQLSLLMKHHKMDTSILEERLFELSKVLRIKPSQKKQPALSTSPVHKSKKRSPDENREPDNKVQDKRSHTELSILTESLSTLSL